MTKMVIASHYVFKDMKRLLEAGDIGGLKDTANSYCKLYYEDAELQRLCGRIDKYILSRNKEDIMELRDEVVELARMRQLQTSGGSRLWFK